MTAALSSFEVIIELTHARLLFEAEIDRLTSLIRRQVLVPDLADADVEEEFASLRADFCGHAPEFFELFARLLLEHLDRESLMTVLEALRSDGSPRYLRAAATMEQGLQDLLCGVEAAMDIAVGSALAG